MTAINPDSLILSVIQQLLGDIGTVSWFHVSPPLPLHPFVPKCVDWRVTFMLTLKGETKPVKVSFGRVEFGDMFDEGSVRLLDFETDCPWLQELANRTLVNTWITLPVKQLGSLKWFLFIRGDPQAWPRTGLPCRFSKPVT